MQFYWLLLIEGILGTTIVVTKTVYVERQNSLSAPLSEPLTSVQPLTSAIPRGGKTSQGIHEGHFVLGTPEDEDYDETDCDDSEGSDSDIESDHRNNTYHYPHWEDDMKGDDHDKHQNNSFYKNYNNSLYNNSNNPTTIGKDFSNLTQSGRYGQISSTLTHSIETPEFKAIVSSGFISPKTMVSVSSKIVDEGASARTSARTSSVTTSTSTSVFTKPLDRVITSLGPSLTLTLSSLASTGLARTNLARTSLAGTSLSSSLSSIDTGTVETGSIVIGSETSFENTVTDTTDSITTNGSVADTSVADTSVAGSSTTASNSSTANTGSILSSVTGVSKLSPKATQTTTQVNNTIV